MEVGQSYNAEINLGVASYQVAITPELTGQELRFVVHIEPGNVNTIFAQDHEQGRLVSGAVIPQELEYKIGDWIDGHYE